jgi:predicted transcriptional regulator
MDKKIRTARDVMTEEVVTIGPEEKMSTVLNMMSKYRYSQIPVVKDGEQIGSICEKLVYKYLFNDFEDTRELMEEKVGDMMNSRLRTVKEDEDIETVKEILEEFEAVLVRRNGEIVGIITRDDL